MSFLSDKVVFKGLTFNDGLLLFFSDEFRRCEVDLTSRFTRSIITNIPFVAAAVDTVSKNTTTTETEQKSGLRTNTILLNIQFYKKQIQ